MSKMTRDDVSSEEVSTTPTRKLKIKSASALRRLSACEAPPQMLNMSSPRSEPRRNSVSFGCTYDCASALQDPSSPVKRIAEHKSPMRTSSSERRGSALSERRGRTGLSIHETQTDSPSGPGTDEKQKQRRPRRPNINIDNLIVVMTVAHSALKLVRQAEDKEKPMKQIPSADQVITAAKEGLESWLLSLHKAAESHRKAAIVCNDEDAGENAQQTVANAETQTEEDKLAFSAPAKRSLAARMVQSGTVYSSSETETEPGTPVGTPRLESLGLTKRNYHSSVASDTSAPPSPMLSPMPSSTSARDAASPAFADRMQTILRALQKEHDSSQREYARKMKRANKTLAYMELERESMQLELLEFDSLRLAHEKLQADMQHLKNSALETCVQCKKGKQDATLAGVLAVCFSYLLRCVVRCLSPIASLFLSLLLLLGVSISGEERRRRGGRTASQKSIA